MLDVSENLLDEQGVLEILASLPCLCVLYLNGNPFCANISPYRKQVCCLRKILCMWVTAVLIVHCCRSCTQSTLNPKP